MNFLMEEGQERVRTAYRDNHDRLARIKATYDPDNLFHVNLRNAARRIGGLPVPGSTPPAPARRFPRRPSCRPLGRSGRAC